MGKSGSDDGMGSGGQLARCQQRLGCGKDLPRSPKDLPSGQGGSQEPWAQAFFQLTSLGLELESLLLTQHSKLLGSIRNFVLLPGVGVVDVKGGLCGYSAVILCPYV